MEEETHENDVEGREKARKRLLEKTNTYYPPLSTLESWIYIILFLAGHVWTIKTLFDISKTKELKYFQHGYLEQGWKRYLGRYQDTSDFEWSFWKKFLYETVIIGLSGHFIVARIADYFCPNHRFKVFLAYSTLFTVNFLGIHGLVFILTHCALQYIAASLSKSVAVCWITGLGLVWSLANKTCITYVKTYYDDEDKAYFLLFATAMCNLRYIAFSIEYVWSHRESSDTKKQSENSKPQKHVNKQDVPREGLRQRKSNSNAAVNNQHQFCQKENVKEDLPLTFIDLLIYQMYFPLFYGGPIITYNEFAAQLKRPPVRWNWRKLISFAQGLLRYAYWHIFIEFTLHFMYFGAMQGDYSLLKSTSIRAICGLSFCHVYFFYMKYLIFYGMPSHFATSDNLTIPGAPHCVGSKHRFTDMWKYFDKGLHKWLVRYIYIPCRGQKSDISIVRTTIGSILPFAFTCYWHGASKAQIYWACFSWIGVYLEMLAFKFYKLKSVQDFDHKYLSPETSRRIRALFSSAMFCFLIMSNIYFLSGVYIANIHVKRIYTEDFLSTLLYHLLLVCGVHSSMDWERWGN